MISSRVSITSLSGGMKNVSSSWPMTSQSSPHSNSDDRAGSWYPKIFMRYST